MAPTNPMLIRGAWKAGYVLDYHSSSSVFVGHDAYGHPRWETSRTPVGDLLYRLKYRRDPAALEQLLAVAADFIRSWAPPVEAVVPVPPSKPRASQPVRLLSEGLAKHLALPLLDVVAKTARAQQVKDVFDYHARLTLLDGAHHLTSHDARGKALLLVDDLFRSGATLNAVTSLLLDAGRARAVYAFCPTRTRSLS